MGTTHPGLIDAIVHPMMPAARAAALNTRNTGRGSITAFLLQEGSVNRRFQIDALVFWVIFATAHLVHGIRFSLTLLQSVSKIQDPHLRG